MKQQKTNHLNSTSTTKPVPLKELRKELLSPTDQDNKDITQMLERLGVVDKKNQVKELLEPKKATYTLMSESGAQYSCDGLSDDLKDALVGFMPVNDLSEISFPGVTYQLQAFGQIGMASAAAIIDISRNGFLYQPNTNKEMSDKKTSLFHDLTEELQITAIMCVVQEASATRQSNNDAMERERNDKQESNKLVN